MNLLIITPWFPHKKQPFGGVFFKDQIKALIKKHNVTLVALYTDNRFSLTPNYYVEKRVEEDVEVIRIYIPKSFPIYNQLHYFISAIKAIKKSVSIPDIIQTHVTYPAGVVGMVLSKLWEIPYVATEHRGPVETLFRSPIHKFLTLKAFKNASQVIAVSDKYGQDIQKYVPTPVNVVPNIISLNKFKLGSPFKQGTFVFGFLGQLNGDIKNLGLLLEAFAILKDRKCSLLIGGAGRLLETYKQKAKELDIDSQVQFLGALNPKEINDFYNQLHAFVISSKYESFNVSGIEAMACGLPVVATKCGGPEHYINSANGILVKNNSVKDLYAGMLQIMDNYGQYNFELIRQFIKKNYTGQTYLNKMEAIYKTVMVKSEGMR